MKRATVCLLVVAAFHHITVAQTPVAPDLMYAWSLDGRWTGVVGDEQSGLIYAIGIDRGAEVDVAGQIQREFSLRGEGMLRRLGGMKLRLGRFPRPTLLTFFPSAELTAHDLSGKRLWSYPRANGINDVWTGDVDGDGSDDVVVGGPGSGGGVHVLDGHGKLRWKSTDIGNPWHVAIGNVLGQRGSQVVTTSTLGKIHIFSGDGSERSDVVTEHIYATMVRVEKLRAEDSAATILLAGRNMISYGDNVMALSGAGATRWRLRIPGGVDSASVSSARPWLALGTFDGQVFVVDAVKGAIIGGVAGQGSHLPEVGWVGNPPLLLVATGDSLNAFRVDAK
jgi:hypothetical protein